jgi:hypothetical protein
MNVAKASPSDISYCKALGRTYSRLFPVQEGMPATDVTTMDRCDIDPQASIATLEKKLRDKKIELPPHEASRNRLVQAARHSRSHAHRKVGISGPAKHGSAEARAAIGNYPRAPTRAARLTPMETES